MMESVAQLTAEQVGERVTIIVPSTGDAALVAKFIQMVRPALASRVLKMVGSWKETLITLECQSGAYQVNVVDELTKMPEVARAEERQQTKVRGNTYREILVTLAKSPVVSPQELSEPTGQNADTTKREYGSDESSEWANKGISAGN